MHFLNYGTRSSRIFARFARFERRNLARGLVLLEIERSGRQTGLV